MIEFDTKLTVNDDLIMNPNLAKELTKEDLTKLGHMVVDGYERDERSRTPWKKRMESAIDLAVQVKKAKSFPWPDASNVKFPLMTIASLQFHSRAYPAIVQTPNLVKCRVVGTDLDGKERERADRIEKHMNYQVLDEDENWEELFQDNNNPMRGSVS